MKFQKCQKVRAITCKRCQNLKNAEIKDPNSQDLTLDKVLESFSISDLVI